ncbi:hypothetical protein BTA51_02720 [Hahella sp. CCB-MM4]|uniref:hypothetical protein n=1 Tax=Hahella sp. (strain CCB-MM4) TaxID=1926491 RepID=UPI000B9BFB1E|nr:hypothetical protein [Hahella sp. CCB-MM4]OZG75315.1 hypothetical protein BTA51_02720 [Hahella sp. CCB-MM4]
MKKHLMVSALAATLIFTGCATTGKRDLSQSVYLRGQFAWWDALDEYKVKRVSSDVYMASAELTADGQPYEMKFGDAGWTSGTNCGYLSQAEDQVLEFGKKSKANCSSVFENFKFTPPETGTYNFYLDVSGEVPLVYVESSN